MVTLTIRDVPEDTRRALAEAARESGQSLQAYTLAVLDREARFRRNLEVLAEAGRRVSGERGAGPHAPDVAEVLRRERARQSSG